MENKVYPIAEIFTSIQGEGEYSGALMGFIRLAGCTVGKPYTGQIITRVAENGDEFRFRDSAIGELPIYTEQCTLYDGRTFACDTNYKMSAKMTVPEILTNIGLDIAHICITGGEPFMHDLNPLVAAIEKRGATAHVETSGTIPLGKAFPPSGELDKSPWEEDVWITVSPKKGILESMIERANEIKLLVDDGFRIDNVPSEILRHHLVYIQPVNGENTVNARNLKLVMELQKQFPSWRVSVQLHKVIEAFIHERVL